MHLTVHSNSCLTPDSQDKSIYYLTLQQAQGETLNYQPGDWLTVDVHNPSEIVNQLLEALGLTGSESIELRRTGLVTSAQALTSHLELTQLNPAILNKLQRQFSLGSWESRQAMMDYAYGRDILDLLELYPELKEQGLAFLNLLSPLAPRYYSIASAPLQKDKVSILYKAVQYQTNNRQRYGVASNFLSKCQTDEPISVEIKANPTFKLPENSEKSIIMIGAGTGLAPFIGFMQQRQRQLEQGQGVGANLLFFGETYQATNCLCCEQLQQWQKSGLIESHLAFSRDQEEKVYVQHRLIEQADKVWSLIRSGAQLYICGSQTVLAKAVKEVLLTIFVEKGEMDTEQAQQLWQSLRKEKRLQLDVY